MGIKIARCAKPDTTEFVEHLLNYTFKDTSLVMEAVQQANRSSGKPDQRLALLGDTLLKHAVLLDWYPTAKTTCQGHFLVVRLLSNANLAAAAREVGLDRHIVRHPQAMRNPKHSPMSNWKAATAVEALIAAVYLDSEFDLDAVRAAMQGFGLLPKEAKASESS